MSGATFICETPDRCDKHQGKLHGYPCHECQCEWEATHPRTVKAIAALTGGRGSVQAVQAAAKADAAALAVGTDA